MLEGSVVVNYCTCGEFGSARCNRIIYKLSFV